MNVLLIHGNGGASSRFRPFLERLEKEPAPLVKAWVPELPGFEGRPLPEGPVNWEVFLQPLQDVVGDRPDEAWILYGHGIGGSILLEWAGRGFPLGNRPSWQPQGVLLHAPIGASLGHRWFPKVMKVKVMRSLIHWLIYQKWLQKAWEKKLFLQPEQIPGNLRDQFFADYQSCAAFPHFFDLIDEDWYRKVQAQLREQAFHFLWGEEERVVASRFLQYWKDDFPNATFELIPGWDHFPMLETPEAFFQKMMQLLQ
jgi:pimeloyl-ACP methyl ester carboxylesterase